MSELRDYQQKHDSWKQQQQKLTSEQASRPEKIEQTVSYETYKMRLANEGVGEYIIIIFYSAVRMVFFHFESNRIVIVGLKSHQ